MPICSEPYQLNNLSYFSFNNLTPVSRNAPINQLVTINSTYGGNAALFRSLNLTKGCLVKNIVYPFELFCINNILKPTTTSFQPRAISSTGIAGYAKYFYIGLGYKMYTYKRKLFVWVGLTHYSLLTVPPSVAVFAKKRRIYIIATNLFSLKQFLRQIRLIRIIDIYKGKGILERKTYKGLLRMKSGKKKQ